MSNQRIIIFDGPDGCGKTQIAAALSERIGVPVFKNEFEWKHFSTENKDEYFVNAIKYQHPYLLSFLKQTGNSVIFDRAHPSEFAYSSVFNRKTDWDALTECDEMSYDMNAKIIIPFRTSYDNVEDEFGVTSEHLEKIFNEYKAFARWTKCEVYFLNVDDEDLDRELREVIGFVGEYDESTL